MNARSTLKLYYVAVSSFVWETMNAFLTFFLRMIIGDRLRCAHLVAKRVVGVLGKILSIFVFAFSVRLEKL